MHRHVLLVLPVSLLAVHLACGGGPPPEPKPTCDLSLDTLPGESFVMLKLDQGGDDKPDPLARMKFGKEDGTLTVAYTVANALHVYDYTCEPTSRDQEVRCLTEPQWARACLSLEVHEEGSCGVEALKKAGFEPTDQAEVEEAMKQAKELVAKARESEQWKTFKLMHNNVANTLQGMLYVKIDPKRCRVDVDDMFVTIYEGERVEDSNPVGANPFVRAEEEYLFEDCDQEGVLADLASEEPPADLSEIPQVREHEAGKPVWYHYVGNDHVEAEDGCTYAVTTWANWKQVGESQPVEVVDGKVMWRTSHTWSPDERVHVGNDPRTGALQGGFLHMKRTMTCDGETKDLDVVCAAARVNEPQG